MAQVLVELLCNFVNFLFFPLGLASLILLTVHLLLLILLILLTVHLLLLILLIITYCSAASFESYLHQTINFASG